MIFLRILSWMRCHFLRLHALENADFPPHDAYCKHCKCGPWMWGQ